MTIYGLKRYNLNFIFDERKLLHTVYLNLESCLICSMTLSHFILWLKSCTFTTSNVYFMFQLIIVLKVVFLQRFLPFDPIENDQKRQFLSLG